MRMRLAALALVMMQAACVSTIGNDFDAAKADTFLIGRTTTTEVIAALGKPYSRSIDKGGTEAWVYRIDRGTSRVTAAAFVPYIGFALDNTKTTSVGKSLEMSFATGVMTSCLVTLSESDGTGSATEAISETMTSGFRQEILCGEAPRKEAGQ